MEKTDWKSIIEFDIQVTRKAIREIEDSLLANPSQEKALFFRPIRDMVMEAVKDIDGKGGALNNFIENLNWED